MLLTVTPNPTIDRTLLVPHLTLGAVHRAQSVHCAAGGKGLNVTRAALLLGVPVLATAPLAGHTGRWMAELALQEGLPAEWHWRTSGETRNCVLMNHEGLDATVVNEPGCPVSAQDWASFEKHVTRLAENAGAVAFSGSHPPGVPSSALSRLARNLASGGLAVYLDSSGEALAEALRDPSGLCVKVNSRELLEGLGLPAGSPDAIVAAGRQTLKRGAALVVVTRGSKQALAISPQGIWSADPPPVKVVSTVGSGDAFLAGLVASRLAGQGLAEALSNAVACGSACAALPLPGRFAPQEAASLKAQVEVRQL